MARKKKAAEAPAAIAATPAEGPVTPPAAPEPARETAVQTPAETPASDVNPFPRIIKTAVLGDGYKIRLQQNQKSNQVQIKFGEGRPAEKPADVILDFIKAQQGPRGQYFAWNDGDRAWGMPIRDTDRLATREKARQVFDQVVTMAARERGTGPVR